jgi:hypothetical protein
MKHDTDARTLQRRQRGAWPIAQYALLERRIDLIERYNRAVGAPSHAVARVQNDFIKDRMEASEMVAFVVVCERLITAARRREADRSTTAQQEHDDRAHTYQAIPHF